MADANTTSERWLPIPGYEGHYEVSDHGNVRSVDRTVKDSRGWDINLKGQPIRTSLSKVGSYPMCNLRKNNKGTTVKVHQLVLMAFVGPRPEGAHGCHWDDDKTNNHLTNLRWASASDNLRDRVRNGLHHQSRKTHCLHGHEFTPENTAVKRNGNRACRECIRRRGREYDAKRRRPNLAVEIANRK